MIEPAHAASLRIAAKIGFTPLADTLYRGDAIRILERWPSHA
jgi:hypothetical protein